MTTTLAHWTVIAVAYVTSRFGLRRHPITGQWSGHPGLDKSHPTIYGTPVRAPFDGANIRGYQHGGAGSWVNIDRGDGWVYACFHLSKYPPFTPYVKAGDIIGYAGNTGNSTGPHTHEELRFNGVHQDPEQMLQDAYGEAPEPVPPTPNTEDWFDMASKQDLKDALAELATGSDPQAQAFQWAIARSVAGVIFTGDGMPAEHTATDEIGSAMVAQFQAMAELVAAANGKELVWDQGKPKVAG